MSSSIFNTVSSRRLLVDASGIKVFREIQSGLDGIHQLFACLAFRYGHIIPVCNEEDIFSPLSKSGDSGMIELELTLQQSEGNLF